MDVYATANSTFCFSENFFVSLSSYFFPLFLMVDIYQHFKVKIIMKQELKPSVTSREKKQMEGCEKVAPKNTQINSL